MKIGIKFFVADACFESKNTHIKLRSKVKMRKLKMHIYFLLKYRKIGI